MKNYLIIILLIALCPIGAQEVLKVTYTSQVKMDIDNMNLDGGPNVSQVEKEAFAKAFQEVHYYELITSDEASTFKKIEKINNDLPKEDGIVVSISMGDSFAYTDLVKQTKLSSNNSFNQDYIVESELAKYDWKISREKSTMLGYEVRKAVHKDSTQIVTAWYAPKITIKSGPSDFWGLPGLILKVKIENLNDEHTQYHFTASEIEILANDTVLEKPTKGKRVSEEAFDELMREQSKRFREMYSDGVDTSD